MAKSTDNSAICAGKPVKPGDEILKYVFKVDGCLNVSERASTKEAAEARIKRTWPRSTVEFIRSEFSHFVDSVLARTPVTASVAKSKSAYGSRKGVSVPKSIEERLGQTLGDTFGGHA